MSRLHLPNQLSSSLKQRNADRNHPFVVVVIAEPTLQHPLYTPTLHLNNQLVRFSGGLCITSVGARSIKRRVRNPDLIHAMVIGKAPWESPDPSGDSEVFLTRVRIQ